MSTAAIVGGSLAAAGVGAAGSMMAAGAQSGAARSAAQLSAQAQANALAEQRREFDIQQGNLAPWLSAGKQALSQLQGFQPFQAPTSVTEQNDPGFQFRLNQGMQALQNSAAAKGGLLGGNTAKALTEYGQNYASNEYGNVYNRAFQQYENKYGQLSNLAGLGFNATGQAGQLGQAASQNIGNIYMGGAAQQGNALMNAGAATASGYAGLSNALGGAFSNLGQLGMLSQLMGTRQFSDVTPDYLSGQLT